MKDFIEVQIERVYEVGAPCYFLSEKESNQRNLVEIETLSCWGPAVPLNFGT